MKTTLFKILLIAFSFLFIACSNDTVDFELPSCLPVDKDNFSVTTFPNAKILEKTYKLVCIEDHGHGQVRDVRREYDECFLENSYTFSTNIDCDVNWSDCSSSTTWWMYYGVFEGDEGGWYFRLFDNGDDFYINYYFDMNGFYLPIVHFTEKLFIVLASNYKNTGFDRYFVFSTEY